MSVNLCIETKSLSKVYGSGNTEVVAMQDATMGVRKGEVVALLGPSGSGKSTFLTAVGLINPPTKGQVIIDGQTVLDGPVARTNLSTFRRKNIGFIFQKSNLIPFLDARENVQIALQLSGWPRAAGARRAMELLDYLGVSDRAANLPSMLSGGQQQRVAVARALANSPRVILADEPTAALDKERGRQVMELFAKVAHEQGAGVIVVTHDHRALDVFDTVYEMEDGRLRLAGPMGAEKVITLTVHASQKTGRFADADVVKDERQLRFGVVIRRASAESVGANLLELFGVSRWSGLAIVGIRSVCGSFRHLQGKAATGQSLLDLGEPTCQSPLPRRRQSPPLERPDSWKPASRAYSESTRRISRFLGYQDLSFQLHRRFDLAALGRKRIRLPYEPRQHACLLLRRRH